MNRRQFLSSSALGAASLTQFPYRLFAGTTRKQASDRIPLEPLKIEVTRRKPPGVRGFDPQDTGRKYRG